MKAFFDANVYVAEALLGKGAEQIMKAVMQARWRIYANQYVVDETGHVLADYLGKSKRFATLTQERILRRSVLVQGHSKATVRDDPKDTPILRAALAARVHYLVTNDRHLLLLNPFESIKILSMTEFIELLQSRDLL